MSDNEVKELAGQVAQKLQVAQLPINTVEVYHVSNVKSTEGQPEWGSIKTSISDDKTYDGVMVGLPVACFSSTLYGIQHPNRSMYPRIDQCDDSHHRFIKKVDLTQFRIFFLTRAYGQRHLLLLDGDDVTENMVADVLTACGIPELAGPDWEHDGEAMFPAGRANVYGGVDNTTFWVNTNFWSPVATGGGEWDTVARQAAAQYGDVDENVKLRGLSVSRLHWLMMRVSNKANFVPPASFPELMVRLADAAYNEN